MALIFQTDRAGFLADFFASGTCFFLVIFLPAPRVWPQPPSTSAATAVSADATVLLTNDNRYEKLLASHPIQVVLIDSLPNP